MLRGTSAPISRIASRNSRRSSASLIASTEAPISSTPYFASVPFSASAIARFSAVWPPTVGRIASGLLALDDLGEDLRRQRLDVGAVGDLRVRHDRRRVAVDEDDVEPLVAQRLAGLGAGVVELAGLADDDRAGADHEDAFDVSAFRHYARLFHCVEELSEQVVGVVRPGRRFGMVLHAEDRLGLVAKPFDRAVVEIHVRDLHVGAAATWRRRRSRGSAR